MTEAEPPATPRDNETHFGFRQVPASDKADHVKHVFDSVATRYDLMNDLMSFGIHRLWKLLTAEVSALRPGDRVLDVAAGTGDLCRLYSRKVGPSGQVVMTDINAAMLETGRDRLLNQGVGGQVQFSLADAERLPFASNSFDLVSIGFGLRNVTDKDAALREMHRVLRPGGQLLVLEFSKPVFRPLAKLYDQYSFRVLPKLGRWVAGDSDSYRYLAESIRMHPDQKTLLRQLEAAGFSHCRYHNLTGGIVALHRGRKA